MSLSAISDLVEQVPEIAFAALAPPQRHALELAVCEADTGEGFVDQRSVALAVRSLARAVTEIQPVLVAIDDLEWLDNASAATLEFALRRLRDERVGVVASQRSGEPPPLRLDNLTEPEVLMRTTVGPLTLAALHQLLRHRLDVVPSRAVLIRIGEASGGNPLFALEVGRLLNEAGPRSAAEPPPVPADVNALVRRRTGRLPTATREVLLAAASLSDPREEIIRLALNRSIHADLEPAERDQIASHERGRVTFGHPLFAAGVYAAATSAERRSMHRRLAETLSESEPRARHLALTVDAPDSEAAAVAEAAATEAAARGAPAAAAELAQFALDLTEHGTEPEPHRILALAAYLHLSCQSARGRDVLESADFGRWPPNLHARGLDLLGMLLAYTEGTDAMRAFGERAVAHTSSPQARAAALVTLAYATSFTMPRARSSMQTRHGSGRIQRAASFTATGGAVGVDTWIGTLNVPGLEFDVTAPTIAGATSRTVRVPRRAKSVRVRYSVTATDNSDGSVRGDVQARLGSAFPRRPYDREVHGDGHERQHRDHDLHGHGQSPRMNYR
jgi:hypothetical protein